MQKKNNETMCICVTKETGDIIQKYCNILNYYDIEDISKFLLSAVDYYIGENHQDIYIPIEEGE